jgi:hypothetical protein
MPTVEGDDDHSGYGVLGTGTPWTYVDRDGNTVFVNSVGVWGLVGAAADVANIIDEVTNNPGPGFGQPVSAAFAGRNALSDGGVAVYGEARTFLGRATMVGFLAGVDPTYKQHAGVYGQSDNHGVIGVATGNGTGVFGSGYFGVRGESNGQAAIQGQGFGAALAGQFLGDVHVTGNISVDGDVFLKNQDICERFPASKADHRLGSVMVAGNDGALAPCTRAYDKRVIGIISGAGACRPAITLGAQSDDRARVPIALVGTAFCLVDAYFAAIEIGDLLTTSDTPAHAMKATDPAARAGCIIGKALAPLAMGRGLVPVVIALG